MKVLSLVKVSGGIMMTQIGKPIRLWISLLSLCLLVSCGPASLADLRCEGEAQTRKLAEILREIENKEELQKATGKLKERFNKIAEILIETRRFSKEETEPSFASEELFVELARLYEMPGGREIIEGAQAEAIQRLKR